MTTVLTDLQALGYEVQAQGDRLHLRWRGEGKLPRAQVLRLVAELQRCKAEILTLLGGPAATGDAHEGSDPPRASRPRRPTPSHRRGPAAPERARPNDTAQGGRGVDGKATRPGAEAPTNGAMGPAAREGTPLVETTRCGWCGATQLWVADTGSGRIYCKDCHAVYNPTQGAWSPGESAKRHIAREPLPAYTEEARRSDARQCRRGRVQRLTERPLGPDSPAGDVPPRPMSPTAPGDRGKAPGHATSPQPTAARAGREARPSQRRHGQQNTNVDRRGSTPHRAQQARKRRP